MQMNEVLSARDVRAFLDLPKEIYQGDKNWIQPLDKDIEQVFDPKKNKYFHSGKCKRWLLQNKDGKVIGRIAAFHSKKYKQQQPTGGVGFFECIDDQAAANFMFDYCQNWLNSEGMEAMDGPINFGERDKWWGLLTDGFYEPLYCLNYNPPYYNALFEAYGFKEYFQQICFAMDVQQRLSEKFYERHALIASNSAYEARRLKKSELRQFAKDFCTVYNKAWAGHGGGKTLEERIAQKMFQTMKPVIDEDISWFVYYNNEPVAIWINIPDLNQYFKHLHGKFGLFQKLKFLWLKKMGKCNRFVGVVFGIVPEHQGKGVDSYMIVEGAKVIQPKAKYEQYEMQWIGDFNPKMVNIAESLGTHRSRILRTMRYLFDRNVPFHRHPTLS